MTKTPPPMVEFARLKGDGPFSYDLQFAAQDRKDMALALGISEIRKLRGTLTLVAAGKRDWRLRADWGATVVQPCVVTLTPVVTRIDQIDERLYLANLAPIEDAEIEMPEDDSIEARPDTLDLTAVLQEMIALALPAYPRADGAVVETNVFAGPGVVPMTDEDARPFASLSALRDALKDD